MPTNATNTAILEAVLEMKEKQGEQSALLQEILKHQKETNGRVTKLECEKVQTDIAIAEFKQNQWPMRFASKNPKWTLGIALAIFFVFAKIAQSLNFKTIAEWLK
jgi:hypothetical protein